MHGKVLTVRHQAVNRRKDNRFAVALDSEQNNIHVKDIVKVIDGPHSVRAPTPPPAPTSCWRTRGHFLPPFLPQGREGEIRHLFRGFAFLHCKKLVENGGMFVCKTRHLVLAGGSKVGVRLGASRVSPAPGPPVVTLVSCPRSAQRRDQLHGGGVRPHESSDQQPHAPRRGRWV